MTKTFYNLINSKKKNIYIIYMNFKVEHAIIAVLVLALLYYVISHRSLVRDLSFVPHDNNPQLKAVAKKHDIFPSWLNSSNVLSGAMTLKDKISRGLPNL